MDQKPCSKCGVVKPYSEFHKAAKEKSGRKSACKVCLLSDFKKYRQSHPERRQETCRMYHIKNADRINAKSAEWYAKNIERAKATRSAWRIVNAEKDRADVAAYQFANAEKLKAAAKRWHANNKHVRNAIAARYRAAKFRATPSWADHQKIAEFYFAADFLGMVTGEWHHVDHAVPLQSNVVCGLHCELNLQILTGPENLSKGNRFWPDMP
jgi:hypothetical protein